MASKEWKKDRDKARWHSISDSERSGSNDPWQKTRGRKENRSRSPPRAQEVNTQLVKSRANSSGSGRITWKASDGTISPAGASPPQRTGVSFKHSGETIKQGRSHKDRNAEDRKEEKGSNRDGEDKKGRDESVRRSGRGNDAKDGQEDTSDTIHVAQGQESKHAASSSATAEAGQDQYNPSIRLRDASGDQQNEL